MRVLIVSPYLPHREVGHGGGMSIRRLVQGLNDGGHEVTLAAFVRAGEEEHGRELSRSVELVDVPFLAASPRAGLLERARLVGDRLLASGRSVFEGRPLRVEKYQRREMTEALERLAERPFDVIAIQYISMAPYGAVFARHPGALVLDTHEVITAHQLGRMRTAESALARWTAGVEALRWANFEARAVWGFDEVVCVTEQDRHVLVSLSGRSDIGILVPGMDLSALKPRRGPGPDNGLLFIGSYSHAPNAEAAAFLLDSVFPQILAQRPTARLTLVGRDLPAELQQKAASLPVRLAGFVDDLEPLFDEHALFLAPILSGGGIKIKCLEALARAMPVVTSPAGAEGIELIQGTHALVEATAEGLATAALALMADRPRREAIGRRGRELVEARYSLGATVESLLQAAGRPRRRKTV